MKINNTEYKVIEDFPNYGISEKGVVINLTNGKIKSQNLRGVPEYWTVRLSNAGVTKNRRVHVLLATYWIPNPNGLPVVNHIDSNKLNNEISNLEWTTRGYNSRHAGIQPNNKGASLYNSYLTDDQVRFCCEEFEKDSSHQTITKLSIKFNTSKDCLRKLRAGDTWFHIRKDYNIAVDYTTEMDEATVNSVWSDVQSGFSDTENARRNNVSVIDVKRLRHKTRYKNITDILDQTSTTNCRAKW